MLDDYKSIPLLAGVSILFLIPIAIGAFAYSSLQSDESNPSEQPLTQENGAEDSELYRFNTSRYLLLVV